MKFSKKESVTPEIVYPNSHSNWNREHIYIHTYTPKNIIHLTPSWINCWKTVFSQPRKTRRNGGTWNNVKSSCLFICNVFLSLFSTSVIVITKSYCLTSKLGVILVTRHLPPSLPHLTTQYVLSNRKAFFQTSPLLSISLANPWFGHESELLSGQLQ